MQNRAMREYTARRGGPLRCRFGKGRAMAGLLAIFAEFEREILRDRIRARLAMRGRTGNGWVGRQPRPWMLRKSGNRIVAVLANPRSLDKYRSGVPQSAESSIPSWCRDNTGIFDCGQAVSMIGPSWYSVR